MKKVIFVASTSYSGSTFLDMTLGNDPAGLSLGEVDAVYEPTEPHHLKRECGCGTYNCHVWKSLEKVPASQLYQSLFKTYPHIDYIVDSSKSPLWINRRIKDLRKQGIDYRIAVIWKTPLEIAQSFDKRGQFDNWARSWVNYYRLLHTLQPEHWTMVKYRDYASDPETLKDICAGLGIDWFAGKEAYWEKTQHILFGNHSARKHLNPNHRDNATSTDKAAFQTVSYTPVEDPALEARVNQVIAANPVIGRVADALQRMTAGDEAGGRQALQADRMSRADIWLREAKLALRILAAKRYRIGFKHPQTVTSIVQNKEPDQAA
ncbi:hypothetical protein Q4485_02325 [Granulosicoccaceae sp. 1_MG-2023]|nr:hypothetical protein [Granulosicoccaceae sp. 1_MG-2023]